VDNLPSLFHFDAQVLQLLCYLLIAPSRLACLPDLAPTEADIRIALIGLLVSLKLQRWHQGPVLALLAHPHPVVVYTFGEDASLRGHLLIKRLLHLVPRQHWGIVHRGKGLLRCRRLLEEVHHFFELVLGALRFSRLL